MKLHVHTAVNLDNLTRNIAREVRSEEESNRSDVFNLTAAAQRNLLDPFGADIVGQGSGHGSFDKAGSDGVGADAA